MLLNESFSIVFIYAAHVCVCVLALFISLLFFIFGYYLEQKQSLELSLAIKFHNVYDTYDAAVFSLFLSHSPPLSHMLCDNKQIQVIIK